MTRRAQLVTVTALTFLVGAVAVVFSLHHRRAVDAARAEAKRAELADYGIVSDGKADFTAVPPMLAHRTDQARLGFELFVDARLAYTPRRTCACCHTLNTAGTDGRIYGGFLTRPFKDAVFAHVFLHDGSATNFEGVLRAMVTGKPFSNGGTLEDAAARLAADATLSRRYEKAFGAPPCVSNLAVAVEQFARTQTTSLRPLDRYLAGRNDALDALQREGLALFRKRCLTCHEGPALGATRVEQGRKVTALRGVSLRKAWWADGSAKTLSEALVRMPSANTLTESDRTSLLAFLKAL